MTTTSRRALLGAVAALGATAIIPAAAEPAATGIRQAFARKIERFRRLDALADRMNIELNAAQARVEAERQAIPHVEWTTPDDLSLAGNPMAYSTASTATVNIARGALDKPYSDAVFQENLVKLAAAADERDQALKAVPSAPAVDALFDRVWRVTDLACDAEMAFYRMPCASAQELHLKVETAIERGALEMPDVVRAIVADLRSLTGEVA